MTSAGASSVEKLRELFPQFTRDTVADVVTQTGHGAYQVLLELCGSCSATSWSDDCSLVESLEDLSTESQATGTSWSELSQKSTVLGRGVEKNALKGAEEWSVGGGNPDGKRLGFAEKNEGWESVGEGPLSLNDWGIAHVKSEEESVCSSEGLYWGSRPVCKKVNFLSVMFAAYGLEMSAIQEVLEDAGGDLDLAVDMLLEVKSRRDDAPTSAWGVKADGRTNGEPQKGTGHSQTLDTEASRKIWKSGTALYETQYPSLGASPGVVTDRSKESVGGRVKQYDADLVKKAKALCRQFCNDPKEDLVVDLLRSCRGDCEVAAQSLRDAGLREAIGYSSLEPEVLPVKQKPSGNVPLSSSWSSQHPHVQVPPKCTVEMSQREFEALYNGERNKVKEIGSLKSELFRQASQAYERGDGILAKKLSLEGQSCAQQHRIAQQQAAENIFRKRNSCIVNTFAIDLHGMHVDEALLYVRTTIKDFKKHMDKWPSKKIIRFVTGKGNHSPDNISRLSPALSSYLKEKGFPYILGPGYFDVDLANVKI